MAWIQNRTAAARFTARRQGFAVVELIVACVVTSVLLGGVYSTFHYCLKVQNASMTGMNTIATAEAVLREMTGALENVAILSDSGPIRGLFRGHDGGSFTCKAVFVERHSAQPGVVMERILYRWHRQLPDEDEHFTLTYQGLPFSGTKCIHPLRQGDQPLDELWGTFEPVIIAKDIDDLSVKYRDATDPSGPWQDQWDAEEIPAVWISVRVGEITRDAIVVPKVQARLLG